MVLGEVYLLGVRDIDSDAVKQNQLKYKTITDRTRRDIEKYINGFAALNNRIHQRDDDFRYERVVLIIADFSKNPVKVYDTIDELKNDQVIAKDSIKDLVFDGFVDDLMKIYTKRFGSGKFN